MVSAVALALAHADHNSACGSRSSPSTCRLSRVTASSSHNHCTWRSPASRTLAPQLPSGTQEASLLSRPPSLFTLPKGGTISAETTRQGGLLSQRPLQTPLLAASHPKGGPASSRIHGALHASCWSLLARLPAHVHGPLLHSPVARSPVSHKTALQPCKAVATLWSCAVQHLCYQEHKMHGPAHALLVDTALA